MRKLEKMKKIIRGPRSSRVISARNRVIASESTPSDKCIAPQKLFNLCWERGYCVRDIVAAINGITADWNNWMRFADNILIEPFLDMLKMPVVRRVRFNSMAKQRQLRQKDYAEAFIQTEHNSTTLMETKGTLARFRELLATDLAPDTLEILTESCRRLEKAVHNAEGA